MGNRIVIWAILIWTGAMAVGIIAAFLGIGGDCAGLAGTALSDCRADAWGRGAVGLALLVGLWLVIVVPMAVVWSSTRGTRKVTDSRA